MGLVTKGKKKATIELAPETMAAIDRQVNLYEGTRSRGSVIDEVVLSVLEADSEVAAEVYAFCLERSYENKNKAREADPISASDFEAKACSYDALRKVFSRALFDDIERISEGVELEDLNHGEKGNAPWGVKAIKLANGRFEIVPSHTVLLNPSREGEAMYAWGVWAFDVESPCGFMDAAYGNSVGPLMAYLSDRNDLWKFGQHKPARFVDENDVEECRKDVIELHNLAIKEINKLSGLEGKTFVVAWAMFDMFATEQKVPVGTSFALRKRGEI